MNFCVNRILLIRNFPLNLQIENFLLTADGELKLCDFGSATTETYAPDVSWSAQQRDMLEDQVSIINLV